MFRCIKVIFLHEGKKLFVNNPLANFLQAKIKACTFTKNIAAVQWSLYNIGKTDEGFLSKAVGDYLSRLKHFTKFDVTDVFVKGVSGKMSPDEVKRLEGAALLRRLPKQSYVVLLDERGSQLTSREFAGWIQQKELANLSSVAFVSGGAYGFSDEIYQLADEKIALSKMTFTHQMVRLFFIEQVYRAYAINKGLPYHND